MASAEISELKGRLEEILEEAWHVREDLGSIPSFADWARLITPQTWMLRGQRLDEKFDGKEADAAPGGVVSRRRAPGAGR